MGLVYSTTNALVGISSIHAIGQVVFVHGLVLQSVGTSIPTLVSLCGIYLPRTRLNNLPICWSRCKSDTFCKTISLVHRSLAPRHKSA